MKTVQTWLVTPAPVDLEFDGYHLGMDADVAVRSVNAVFGDAHGDAAAC